ncbi:MAG: VanW family protein [Candidatus Kerfeldbacteria bacterium]|nr:VanW family protein [Candidatus Kerfeldbacteria bacterium]
MKKPAGPQRWLLGAIIAVAILIGLSALVGIAYAAQSQVLLNNAVIGSRRVGGLDTLSALNQLQQAWGRFADQGFTFVYGDERVTIQVANAASSEEEVILDIATLDLEASVNQAYDYGHTGAVWRQAWERVSSYLNDPRDFSRFNLAAAALEELLHKRFGQHDKPAVNAGIEVAESRVVTLTPSQPGQTIDYEQAMTLASQRLRTLSTSPIMLKTKSVAPDLPSAPELKILAETEVPAALDKAPVILTVADKQWSIDRQQLRGLLGFVLNPPTAERAGEHHVGFDRVKTAAWLETIRPEIDIKPREAKFKVVDGRAEEFQTSVVGRTLDTEASVAAMNNELIFNAGQNVVLVTVESKPLTDTVSTNALGIKELVAEGITDFRGSPPNRVFNLSLGAERLNGILVKPGETFSLVEALGPIDQAHGWKPELVIKGTKIKPEYGGGLCQVATTMFRAALNTGLPILERQNHSLRISYYEPPIGLDATIYEPKPDLKFKNDYATALLLQTRVEGTKLIFSFYGTKDGRKIDIPEPKVFNRVPIPTTQKIEVDDLPPGQEQCQAPGHPGADAIATYTVTKADGSSVTQEFKSHYRALPVICRVGKAAPASPALQKKGA